MAEINNSGSGQWSETDANNTSPSPDGWPTGTYFNQVEPNNRSMMGAIKRFWDRINYAITSTGSSNAYVYTPANTSYPTAYVAGERYTFTPNFTSTAASTLNINGLGVKNIYVPSSSGLIATSGGELVSGVPAEVVYNGTNLVLLNPANNVTLATFASPPGIGGTTPAAGSFTTLSAMTSGSPNTLIITDVGANGAGIKLAGNGSTTPNKWLRVFSGMFNIMNNTYSSIFTLTDAGVLTTSGGISGTTFDNGAIGGTTPAAGNFTTLNSTTSGSTNTITVTDTGSNGANVKLVGNGSTTPNKYIRSQNGVFGILNSAYSAAIMTLDDSGDLGVNGTFTSGGNTTATKSASGGTVAITSQNSATGANTYAEFQILTGTSNSSWIVSINDNSGTPYAQMVLGSAVSGLNFVGTYTATTQSAGDNSTKLATTAYADRSSTNAVQMTALGVGSIILAQNLSGGTITAGGTTAAANITPIAIAQSTGTTSPASSGDTLAGTWKALQRLVSGNGSNLSIGLWQRTV